MQRVRVHTLTGEDVLLAERTIQTWQASLRDPLLRAGDDGYEEVRATTLDELTTIVNLRSAPPAPFVPDHIRRSAGRHHLLMKGLSDL